MTNEEMQTAVAFMVNQQAQTAVKLDRLTEGVDALTVKVDGLVEIQNRAEQRWERTEAGIRSLLAIAEMHEKEIATLTENGRATDDRLNALINVVERQISNGRKSN
ncbi:MAG: hypothetical protein WAM70_04640 [Pyrinomonadaceae bacterium]